MDKKSIRTNILAKRDCITDDAKKIKDEKIRVWFSVQSEYIDAKSVMFFVSFRSEPDTLVMIEAALSEGKKVIVPRVDKALGELVIYEIKNLNELKPGYMKILEPDVNDERLVLPNSLDLIVMPGAAFDSSGGRIGYGGGFYDRFLTKITVKPPLVALAYVEQIVDRVPIESHDIKVDKVISDEGVIISSGEG